MEIRKFLKKVGITSQREISNAVYKALEKGDLGGSETLSARMKLELPDLELTIEIEGDIALD